MTLTTRHITFMMALILVGIAVSCGRGVSAVSGSDSLAQEPDPVFMLDEECDDYRWADSVMSGMTLEQMAGQLIFPAVYSNDSELAIRSVVAYVADSHIGGVVLLKGTPEAARVIADTLASLSCAPPLVAIDAEWGLAMRLSNTPRFPKNGKISALAEDSIMYEYGMEVARECREVGVNMVLGPVLDVLPEGTTPFNTSIIGSRSFGDDPQRAAALGVAYARGLEDGGVASVAKHFPGHGSADADSHKKLPIVDKTLDQLVACDLLPFVRYVEEGLSAIMVGHLFVPALEPHEVPVSVSEKILKGFMRDEMGFEGLIVTDAMNMAGAEGRTGADAIIAGADIVLTPRNTRLEVESLMKAIRNGTFLLDDLRLRVRRVLIYKKKFSDVKSSEVRPTLNHERIREALIR